MEFTGWTPVAVADNTLRADGSRMYTGRTGVHLSSIIHAAKIAARENVDMVEGDQEGVRIQEGFLWEIVHEYIQAGMNVDESIEAAFKRLNLQLRAGIVTQLRLELRGIKGTPDALNPNGPEIATPPGDESGLAQLTGVWGVPELESYKATRRSLRNARTALDFENNFWTWVMQEAGYCKMSGIRQVRWVVWWIAGDYSKGKGTGPRMLEARVRYSEEDIERHWLGICTIADRLEREKA